MNVEKFINAYNEPRNGADGLYHGFLRSFTYSNGVKDCADAGCHWLIDILATEGAVKIRKAQSSLTTVEIKVAKESATIRLLGSGDIQFWKKRIAYTDLPDGTWNFLISDEGHRFVMILLSEY